MSLEARLPQPNILSAPMPDNTQRFSVTTINPIGLNYVPSTAIITNLGEAIITDQGDYMLYA